MRSPGIVCARSTCNFGVAALLAMSLAVVPAPASTVWNWQYSGPDIAAGGSFTTNDSPDVSGGYLITAITGTRNRQTITALQPPGTAIPGNEPFVVDDLIFRGPGPQLTSGGFGFATSDGNFSNPFYADFLPTPGYLEFFSMPGAGNTELPVVFAATPVATPEPATYVLILAGAGLFGLWSRFGWEV
jgi:PEP-CTERM motif